MSRWDALLAVQEHDTALDQLRHQSETLPERASLDAVMGELAGLEREASEVQGERQRLARDQQRIEDEVTTLNEKAAQSDKVLYGGTISNPRELQALQDEIGSLKRRISRLEDDELELMEATEPLDARLAVLTGQRGDLDEKAGQLRATIAEAEADIGAQIEVQQSERARVSAEVDPSLLAEYDELRPRLGGIAIAPLVGSRCGGCHLTLPAVEVDRIKKLAPDDTVRCEECGRLLAR